MLIRVDLRGKAVFENVLSESLLIEKGKRSWPVTAHVFAKWVMKGQQFQFFPFWKQPPFHLHTEASAEKPPFCKHDVGRSCRKDATYLIGEIRGFYVKREPLGKIKIAGVAPV